VRGTCQDLAACFAWKQVRLWFPNLASRLVEVRHRWCTWQHRGGCVDFKQMGDTTGCIEPCYAYFAIFIVLGPGGILVF
jgi:hypothetical protein